MDGAINWASPRLPRFRDVADRIARIVERPVRLRIPDKFARMILGGGADYFLVSYDIRPSRATAGGCPFRHAEPSAILDLTKSPQGGILSPAAASTGSRLRGDFDGVGSEADFHLRRQLLS
jgi:hypothetical protein